MKEFFLKKIKPASIWFFKSFIWLALLIFIIDILSKSLVVANRDYILSSSNQGLVLIPNFLAINYVINTGAAFGLSAGDSEAGFIVNRIIYIIIATLAIGGLIFFYCKKYASIKKYYKACIMLIIAGAFGNLVDRIFYTPSYLGSAHNGVVDWINFFGIWGYNFNIADSALVIGVIMTIIYLIIEEVRNSRANKAKFKKDNTAISSKVENVEAPSKEEITKDNKKEE